MGFLNKKSYQRILEKSEVFDFFFSMALVVIFFIITINQFSVIYDTNDDWFLRDILSGAITGTIEGHGIFMKYPLSIFISALYQLVPIVPWFGYYLIGCWMLCCFLIVYTITKNIYFLAGKILIVVGFFFFYMNFGIYQVTTIQHMSTAGILFATAIFLMAANKETEQMTVKIFMKKYWLILLLSVLSFSTRHEAFILLLPIWAVVIFIKLVAGRKSWKEYLLLNAVLVAGVALILLIDGSAYTSSEWKEFKAYNRDRSQIYDYYKLPAYEENQEFYSDLNITSETYVGMLEGYMLLLYPEINSQDMNNIRIKAQELYNSRLSFIDHLKIVKRDYLLYLEQPNCDKTRIWILYFLYGGLTLTAALNKKILFILSEILTFSAFRGCWLILFFINRNVIRATQPLFFAEVITIIALAIYFKVGDLKYKKLMIVASGVIIPLVLIYQLTGVAALDYKDLKDKAEILEIRYENLYDIEAYCMDHPENIYYIDIISVQHDSKNALQKESNEKQNFIYMGGWLANSPLIYNKLAEYEITNPREALINKENLYIIFRKEEEPQTYFWNSIDTYYEYEITSEESFFTRNGDEYLVYKLTGKDRE